MTLSFFVEKQNIVRTDTETPATNSICYLKAKFEFGRDWESSHNICPRFRAESGDVVYVPPLVNGRYLNEEGICFVPIELLQNVGRFLVSVTDETDGVRITTSEAYVTVVKGSNGMYSPSIQSLDLQYENENGHLQLTANGEAVGNGATIPTPSETFVKTLFDYEKLKDNKVTDSSGNAFSLFAIMHNLNNNTTTNLYITFTLLKDLISSDEEGNLVVTPVQTGLPTLLYRGSFDNLQRELDKSEKIDAELLFGMDGETIDITNAEFLEMLGGNSSKAYINYDITYSILNYIDISFSASYDNAYTANEIKAALKEEILPFFIGLKVAIDRTNWIEQESEVVYNAE